VRVACVGLAVVVGVEEADSSCELRRDIDDLLTVFEESLREGRPAPLLPSTAQTRSGQASTYLSIAE
jgi:hypothetical protein